MGRVRAGGMLVLDSDALCSDTTSSVKVINESTSDIRRIQLPARLTFSALKTQLVENFGPGPWSVCSADGPVLSDYDLQRAVRSAAGSVLRVTIRLIDDAEATGKGEAATAQHRVVYRWGSGVEGLNVQP